MLKAEKGGVSSSLSDWKEKADDEGTRIKYDSSEIALIKIFAKGFGSYFNGRLVQGSDESYEKSVISWCLKTCLEKLNPSLAGNPRIITSSKQKIHALRREEPNDRFKPLPAFSYHRLNK